MLKKAKKRDKCEDAIRKHLRAIWRIYKEYNPTWDYITIHIRGGEIFGNNQHWAADKEFPIEFCVLDDGEKWSVLR